MTLRIIGLFTKRDLSDARDAGWVEGFLCGAKGKGVVNINGCFRPAKTLPAVDGSAVPMGKRESKPPRKIYGRLHLADEDQLSLARVEGPR